RAHVRPDRLSHLYLSGHGIAAAAADRVVHGSPAAAVFVGARHGVLVRRAGVARRGGELPVAAARGGARRNGFRGAAPRVVAGCSHGRRQAARSRAIAVSARRQLGIVDWAVVCGGRGVAVWADERRLVCARGRGRNGAAHARGTLVQAAWYGANALATCTQ